MALLYEDLAFSRRAPGGRPSKLFKNGGVMDVAVFVPQSPHPLPMREGADRACRRLVIKCHDSSLGESALVDFRCTPFQLDSAEGLSPASLDFWATYPRNRDLWGSKRFYRWTYDKRSQNDGAREDKSSAVSETVDAGICKS